MDDVAEPEDVGAVGGLWGGSVSFGVVGVGRRRRTFGWKKSCWTNCTRPLASTSGASLGQTVERAWDSAGPRSWTTKLREGYCLESWMQKPPTPPPTSTTVAGPRVSQG